MKNELLENKIEYAKFCLFFVLGQCRHAYNGAFVKSSLSRVSGAKRVPHIRRPGETIYTLRMALAPVYFVVWLILQ